MRIIELEEVDSTNEYLKRENFKEDCIVVAKRQSAGKGTKGRSFSSEEGGLYISVMRRYEDFPAENAFKIMVNACVAVCKTLESFGIKPVIRWANDVLVGGKKICGTLIENTFSNGRITRSIVGMGINVNNDFPEELKKIAISIKQLLGKETDIRVVSDKLTDNVHKNFAIEDYKSYINYFGCAVTLKQASGERIVIARDVAEDGRLVVEDCGETRKISSAEVTLRL